MRGRGAGHIPPICTAPLWRLGCEPGRAGPASSVNRGSARRREPAVAEAAGRAAAVGLVVRLRAGPGRPQAPTTLAAHSLGRRHGAALGVRCGLSDAARAVVEVRAAWAARGRERYMVNVCLTSLFDLVTKDR